MTATNTAKTYLVVADTANGIEIIDAPLAKRAFVEAENFIAWLPRMEDDEIMWTELTQEQAEALHAEYGIGGFTN